MEEFVVLVDENDNEIGIEEKMKAHEEAKLHRAFSIFIFNSKNEMLLQQRHDKKYHCPGLWSNTCCSHPRPDEDILTAAKRRLKEEMDIVTDLKLIGKFNYQVELPKGLFENELDYVLIGYVDDDDFAVNREEVKAYKWVDLDVLQHDVNNNPNLYTHWLGRVISITESAILV